MKTIEERADEFSWRRYTDPEFVPEREECKEDYIVGAKEQKRIDINKACDIFCHIGCPHKTDDYDCLKDKCIAWKTFRKMMEE